MHNKKPSQKHLTLIIVVNSVAVCILAWYGWMYLNKKNSRDINGLAQKAGEAFATNDFKTYYRQVDSREIESFDMTESKARALWDELYAPRIERYFSGAQCELEPMSGSQAQYRCTMQVDGKAMDSGVLVTWSPRKGTASLVMQLPELWKLEYMEQTKQPLGELGEFEAIIAGVTKDRSTLEKYGVTGFIGNTPTSKVSNWDTVLSKYKQILAQRRNLKTN
ncbi:MAG: hypothetical protein KDC26_10605 [Armatimonadetes bacterium]|nr:hypothetical protein [Armatimonadota bacterium]